MYFNDLFSIDNNRSIDNNILISDQIDIIYKNYIDISLMIGKKVLTRFVNYTAGPPKDMFLGEREI